MPEDNNPAINTLSVFAGTIKKSKGQYGDVLEIFSKIIAGVALQLLVKASSIGHKIKLSFLSLLVF